jgi:hypothetical protein
MLVSCGFLLFWLPALRVAHPTVLVPLSSSSVAPTAHSESADLHCDHCGQDGHVEAFC